MLPILQQLKEELGKRRILGIPSAGEDWEETHEREDGNIETSKLQYTSARKGFGLRRTVEIKTPESVGDKDAPAKRMVTNLRYRQSAGITGKKAMLAISVSAGSFEYEYDFLKKRSGEITGRARLTKGDTSYTARFAEGKMTRASKKQNGKETEIGLDDETLKGIESLIWKRDEKGSDLPALEDFDFCEMQMRGRGKPKGETVLEEIE